MISSGFGKQDKLYILAYEDKARKSLKEKYTATINPETYTTRHKIEFCETQAPGTSMPILKFNRIPAQEISFDFLFDSTGVIRSASPVGFAIPDPTAGIDTVADQIDEFRNKIILYQGTIHRPYYLVINWGTLLFKCVLTDLSIEYKLFRPDGKPIRAVAKCTFKGTIEEPLRKRQEKKESPDVTHERLVRSGDRLSLMTYKIYNNQKYLPYVAAFNRLDGFRSIRTGTRIYFPPVEK